MAERVEGRVALGYVTAWGKVLPDPTYLTHINYAFAGLYMDGDEYRKFGIQGEQARFDAVKALKKQNPQLKILLSFNNTNMNRDGKPSGGFSALAKSPEMRKRFAEDCRRFVEKEGIDGIDIDWEFPGLTYGHAEFDTIVDVDNFTLLMKDLRAALGPDILLTYAGYCKGMQRTNGGGKKYIDVAAVDPYVDFVNIMTYDFDSAPHHQSAFDDPENSWDCRRAVQAYLDAGVPASKLVLGIPFYARHDFQRGGSVRFCNLGTWAEADGYKTDCWDERAGVPHVGKDGAFHAGYDNPRSIALKGKWLLGLGMKGMMFWEYEGDDEQGTLQRAIWDAVMAKPEPPADAPVRDFIARSADYRSLLADCEKLLGTSQYMAGKLLKVDYAYPGYEGYPVKLYEYYTAPDVKTGEKKRGLGEGYFNAPGGHIEEAETAMEAAVRETKEETGVDITDTEKLVGCNMGSIGICMNKIGTIMALLDEKGNRFTPEQLFATIVMYLRPSSIAVPIDISSLVIEAYDGKLGTLSDAPPTKHDAQGLVLTPNNIGSVCESMASGPELGYYDGGIIFGGTSMMPDGIQAAMVIAAIAGSHSLNRLAASFPDYRRDSREVECTCGPDAFVRAMEGAVEDMENPVLTAGEAWRVELEEGWYLISLARGPNPTVRIDAESADRAYLIGLMEVAEDLVSDCMKSQ